MAISHQIKPRFATRNEEIVAGIIEAAGAVPPLDPYVVIKRKAAELSTAMALLHGGDWRVEVDHEDCFVVVRRRSQPRPTGYSSSGT